MSFQELSFAPDRRSVQATFYHFSERPSGDSDRRGFSQQDSLIWALDKIYQSKFGGIQPPMRALLVNILISEVPLSHHNLTMLAAANFIVFHMRLHGQQIMTDPISFPGTEGEMEQQNRQIFERYFNSVESIIISDVNGLTPDQINLQRANYKVTLLRYIIYIQNNTTNYMNRTERN